MPKRADKARQYHYLYVEGHVLYLQGHHSQALPKLEEAVARNPEFFTGRLALAACYAQLGMLSEAEWERAELQTLNPGFSIASERINALYQRSEHLEHLNDGLKMAGLR